MIVPLWAAFTQLIPISNASDMRRSQPRCSLALEPVCGMLHFLAFSTKQWAVIKLKSASQAFQSQAGFQNKKKMQTHNAGFLPLLRILQKGHMWFHACGQKGGRRKKGMTG